MGEQHFTYTLYSLYTLDTLDTFYTLYTFDTLCTLHTFYKLYTFYTFYTLCTLYTFAHFIHFIRHSHKGEGNIQKDKKRKGKAGKGKREKRNCGQPLFKLNSCRQPDRANTNTHERNETISRLGSPHNLRSIEILRFSSNMLLNLDNPCHGFSHNVEPSYKFRCLVVWKVQ